MIKNYEHDFTQDYTDSTQVLYNDLYNVLTSVYGVKTFAVSIDNANVVISYEKILYSMNILKTKFSEHYFIPDDYNSYKQIVKSITTLARMIYTWSPVNCTRVIINYLPETNKMVVLWHTANENTAFTKPLVNIPDVTEYQPAPDWLLEKSTPEALEIINDAIATAGTEFKVEDGKLFMKM